MKKEGKVISGGIAVGRIFVYKNRKNPVEHRAIGSAEEEIARFQAARETAEEQLRQLYEKVAGDVGKDSAAIFEAHRMMLEDRDLIETVAGLIRGERLSAECAVSAAGEKFSAMFEEMDDVYLQARATDIKDICGRVISVLQGTGPVLPDSGRPVILAADDLTPSETVQFDSSQILAFVLRRGAVNSHTAILARCMHVPALTDVDFADETDGQIGIVDGEEGVFLTDPDEDTLAQYREKQRRMAGAGDSLRDLRGKKSVTADGRSIRICANISGADDVLYALKNGAGGVGLFRTEFLYLESETFPTEEEQYQEYRAAVELMDGRRVVFRTADIGADKQADYFELDEEENSAMGCRGIRVSFARPEIFRTQLRAILRAAYFGNAAVMYPMITSVAEVQRIKAIVEEVKQELDREGILYGEPEQGIMIETPAAVWISEELAREVDFFSIGTNDLTQFILAADRENPDLDDYYDPYHPAVLRAVRTAVENAHKAGIRAGICGELAGDPEMTEEFLRMGADELSVNPAQILPLRAAVRGCDLSRVI